MNKTCTKCKANKIIEEFCVVRKNKDGRNTRCKLCCNDLSSEWRKKDSSKWKKAASEKIWREANRERIKSLKKKYRERNPERAREIVRKCLAKNREKYKPQKWRQALRRLYNLTPEEFYNLQKAQNNCCWICGLPEVEAPRQKLCVDHCHNTNIVRGLLCFNCNVILGNARDSIEILEKAVEYLKKANELPI